MWNFNHTEHINCYKLNIVLKFIIFSDGPGHKIEKKMGSVSSSNVVCKTGKCFPFFRNLIVMLFQCLISSFLPSIWFSCKAISFVTRAPLFTDHHLILVSSLETSRWDKWHQPSTDLRQTLIHISPNAFACQSHIINIHFTKQKHNL